LGDPPDFRGIEAELIGDCLALEQRTYPNADLFGFDRIIGTIGGSAVEGLRQRSGIAAWNHREYGNWMQRHFGLERREHRRPGMPFELRRNYDQRNFFCAHGDDCGALVERHDRPEVGENAREQRVVVGGGDDFDA